jgi:E3 ubiquitin-protein ligase DOA10
MPSCTSLTLHNRKCKRKCCTSRGGTIRDKCSYHFQLFKLDKPTECPICTEELPPDMRPSKCGHYFHQECLQTWFKTSQCTSCPVCRKDIGTKSLHSLCNTNENEVDLTPYFRLSTHLYTLRTNAEQQGDTQTIQLISNVMQDFLRYIEANS